MKIIITTRSGARLTLDDPDGVIEQIQTPVGVTVRKEYVPQAPRRMFQAFIEAARRKERERTLEDERKAACEYVGIRMFMCCSVGSKRSRMIRASNPFNAAEIFAAIELPNQRGPWTATDVDPEKFAAGMMPFVRVLSGEMGFSLRVVVRDVASEVQS